LILPRRFLSSVFLGALLLASPRAWAQSEDEDDDDELPAPEDPAFQYTKPTRPDYVRAAVGQAVVLGLGFLQYTADKANAEDWDLSYDWQGMRSKLLFESVSFDNNRFPTNWITHPAAGMAYYTAARSARLGVLPSFAMTLGSAAIWEYVGEWKEHVAINDVIATPVSGMSLAEPLLQIGALMHRSRQNTGTRFFGWFFAPLKSIYDRTDGLDPKQADHVDELGLPAEEWHRFRIGASVGVTKQQKGVTEGETRLRAESRIVALPDYGLAGQRDAWFDSAEVSEISTSFTLSEHSKITDFNVAAHILPFGYRWQDVRVAEDGELRGASFLGGFHIGTEYGTHDYDRDGRRDVDRVGLVAGGVTFEEWLHVGGGLSIRSSIDFLANFAGVEAYGLPEYRRDFGDLRLTSVLRYHGYYHGYGATVRPRVEVKYERLDTGADFRADYFDSITGLDVEPVARVPESPAHDRRLHTRAWVGYQAAKYIRLSLTGEHRDRDGTMPGAGAARSEISGHFGVDLQF
jgi:hypothetical protein